MLPTYDLLLSARGIRHSLHCERVLQMFCYVGELLVCVEFCLNVMVQKSSCSLIVFRYVTHYWLPCESLASKGNRFTKTFER